MKDFFKTWEKDIQKDGFTKKECIIYGIIAPIVLFAIMALAGWMDSLV